MVVNSGQTKRNRLQYTTRNPREGAAEVGSEMKGSGFYLAKRVSDNITSFFVTTKEEPAPFMLPDLGRR